MQSLEEVVPEGYVHLYIESEWWRFLSAFLFTAKAEFKVIIKPPNNFGAKKVIKLFMSTYFSIIIRLIWRYITHMWKSRISAL